MPKTKAGLPTDDELKLMSAAVFGNGTNRYEWCLELLREVRSRTLLWAVDQAKEAANDRRTQ